MQRITITLFVALFALVASAFAPGLLAQRSERNDVFPRQRFFDLALPRTDQQQEFYLNGRLYIENVVYNAGEFTVEVYVGWLDGQGKPIDGISVNVSVWSMPGWVTDAGNRPMAERIDAIQADSNYYEQSLTDTTGIARVRMEYPVGTTNAGLQPGEYTIKVELDVGSQAPAVQARMKQDPNLFGVYNDEDGNVTRPRTDEEKDARWFRLTQKQVPVPAAFNKLYVTPDESWVDEGTLAAHQEVVHRRTEWQDALKNLENKKLLKATQEEIDAAAEWEEATREWFEVGGGELTRDEITAYKRAVDNKYEISKKLLEWEDDYFRQYITLVHGDFRYWEWKANTLYGYTLYVVCNTGKLPWESESELAKARSYMGEDFKMKDVKDWRKYMKRLMTILVEGDKSTWEENWEEEDGKRVPPAGHPSNGSEWRGGNYPEAILDQMHDDVDAFDPSDFVNKKTKTDENGVEVVVYEPNDLQMQAFEANFAVAMGMDPNFTQSSNAFTNGFSGDSSTVQTMRFEMFEFQEDMKQRIMAYDPSSGGTKALKLSTGDRVRVLDMRKAYGYNFTRFQNVAEHMQRSLEYLSYFPASYRFTIYRYVMNLPLKECNERMGIDTPASARNAAQTNVGKMREHLKEAQDGLRFRSHPLNGQYIFGPEGQFRNYPMDSAERFFGGVTREARIAYEEKRIGNRIKDPDAKAEISGNGESDIEIETDGNKEDDRGADE